MGSIEKGQLNSCPLLMLTPKHTSNTGRIALQMYDLNINKPNFLFWL